MSKASDIAYAAGTQGAGMKLDPTVGPADVSFYRIEWQEQPGPASSVTGYFVPRNVGDSLKHNPYNGWVGFGQDNKCACQDTAAFSGYPAPWTAGGFEWIIPNHFQIIGDSAGGSFGNGALFTNVTQAFSIEGAPNAGRSTVTKAGASVTRAP